jgi:hypothetical protein
MVPASRMEVRYHRASASSASSEDDQRRRYRVHIRRIRIQSRIGQLLNWMEGYGMGLVVLWSCTWAWEACERFIEALSQAQ